MMTGHIEAALRPGAPGALLVEACGALRALAARALAGNDPAAFREYHATLYDLHDRDDPHTDVARRYIAAQAYAVEERCLERVALGAALDEAELHDHIQRSLAGSRSQHPAVQHLTHGHPSMAELRVFLSHQWFRTCKLYQDAGDLAVTLSADIRQAATLYSYLHDETGEGNPEGAHALLLANLLRHLEIPCELSLRSTCLEEIVYLNNRRRSFRSPDPEWALAIFYATELVVSAMHQNLVHVLATLGVPPPLREYYRVHIELVPPRAEREWAMFRQRLRTKESQELFLTSLAHHLRVERRYFDVIWREMQDARRA